MKFKCCSEELMSTRFWVLSSKLNLLYCVLDFCVLDSWLMAFYVIYVVADSVLLSWELLTELNRNQIKLLLSGGDLIGEISATKVKLRHCNAFFFGKINDGLWRTQAKEILSVSSGPLYVVRFAWRIKKGIFKGIWNYFWAMDPIYFVWAS